MPAGGVVAGGGSVVAVLRVVPVVGETTWSFLNRVAAAYGMQAADLAAQWRSANRVPRKVPNHGSAEVLLDVVAQEQLAGWCGVPAGHLARALPSWAAGPQALANRDRDRDRDGDGDRRGWMRWHAGVSEWGPVVLGCGLCAARRGAGGRVWVYGPQWRQLCVRHGRWLLEPGEGHPLEWVEVACWLGSWVGRSVGGLGWRGPSGRVGWRRGRCSRWRGRWCVGGGSGRSFGPGRWCGGGGWSR
ncbi:TniQ family protein [Streptomyces sp. SAI-126]|uniref:TniQ family protein n=1 Tax=Streptomyces sp. SAI-126 TaxID=3377732 RepID=UPI003C7D6C94